MSPGVATQRETLRKAVACLCIGDVPFDERITKAWLYLSEFHSGDMVNASYTGLRTVISMCSNHFDRDYLLVTKAFSNGDQLSLVARLLDAFQQVAALDDGIEKPQKNDET
jgi:hypothetical protein